MPGIPAAPAAGTDLTGAASANAFPPAATGASPNRFVRPPLRRPGLGPLSTNMNSPASLAAPATARAAATNLAPSALTGSATNTASAPPFRPNLAPPPGAPPGPGGAVPGVGANVPGAAFTGTTNIITPGGTNLPALTPAGKIVKYGVNLQTAPLEQVLNSYSFYTGRSIFRPATLPAASITFRNEQELTIEEAVQALEAVLALNGVTMLNVGEKFASAVPTAQALQEGAAFSKVDGKSIPEAGQFLTKVVQVKHVQPSELVQLLQSFGKVQNGIIPIDPTMTLVLRDYPANIKRMLEMIEKVDVVVESDYKLEVIPIKYGKVEEVYSTFSSLVGGGGGAATPATGTAGVRRTSTSRMTGARGGMGGLGTRTGYGSQNPYGQNRQTGQFQQQAVQPGQVGGGTTSFNQRLQQLVSRIGGAGDLELLKDAHIVPDQRSNSLIVYATKEDMAMITNILAKVDRLMAQVLIEAIIMDVELSDSRSLGVSALMNPQKTGDLTSTAANNGGATLLSGVTNLSSSLPSGFNYWGMYKGDLQVAVTALSANSRGHILATPRVQTTHATEATFDVTDEIPYVGTLGGNAGYYGYSPAQVQFAPVQTTLSVTPYITPDGLVVMDVQQQISEATLIDLGAQGAGKAPRTTSRSTMSTVSVQSGETVILGGYIRTSKNNSKSGVPVLKDIPLLGTLFRSTSRDESRSELIVLIRPTVLASPKDAARLAEQEQLRLPGVREMQKEMREDEQKRQEQADRLTGKNKKP